MSVCVGTVTGTVTADSGRCGLLDAPRGEEVLFWEVSAVALCCAVWGRRCRVESPTWARLRRTPSDERPGFLRERVRPPGCFSVISELLKDGLCQ